MFRAVKEHRDIIFSGLVFLSAYSLLAIIIMRPIQAYDTFWHLQMGKDLLEHGLSPWVDHYSVSYLGKAIYPVPVMFQTLLYKFVSFFGEQAGFYCIRLFYITLMLLALWVYFRKINANAYIVFILLPLIVSAISLRIIIRPEIFSNVMVVICLMLYLNAQKNFAIKELLAICLLLLFWTSYHSPIIGYIIIFGLFLEKAINKLVHKDGSFSWSQWFLWGLLIFSIGFINLNFHGHSIIGQHFIIGMINTVSDGFGRYTMEYRDSYSVYSTDILTNILWMLSIYVAILSLIKRQYGFAFIVILLTLLSWSMVRLLAIVLIINLCVLAGYWAQFLNSPHFSNLRNSVKKTLLVASVCISLMAYYFLAVKAQASKYLSDNRTAVLQQQYPVQVTDYLKHYRKGGNILNRMRFGGYLMYRLSPDYKVYFDGRTNILYPIEFFKYNIALWGNEKMLDDAVDKYDINYVVRKNTPADYALIKKAKNVELSFSDDNFMLFSRTGKAQFPLASTLLAFPRCWRNHFFQTYLSKGIQAEIELSEKLFINKQYTIKTVLAFVKKYRASKDKKKFFNTLKFDKKDTDGVRRIALYMAMDEADKYTVSRLFSSIRIKTFYGILLYAYYEAKHGEYINAMNWARYFMAYDKAGKVYETKAEFGVLGRILRILKKHDELGKIKPEYVEKLEAHLKKAHYPFDKKLSFSFMCK